MLDPTAAGDPLVIERIRRDVWWLCALGLLAVASHWAFFALHFGGTVPFAWDSSSYVEPALSLLRGQGYQIGGMPNAMNPPTYPFLLAAVYGAFGRNDMVVVVVQWILGAGSAMLVYALARRVVSPLWAGMAGLAMCWHVDMLLWHSYVLTEALGVFQIVLVLWLAVRFVETGQRRWVPLSASVYGMALLTRPIFVSLFPWLVVWFSWVGGRWGKSGKTVLTWLVVLTCVLAPWAVRNRIVMGAWYLLSSKTGDAMFWSVNWRPHIGDISSQDPKEIAGMSRVEAERYLRGYAVRVIKENPLQFARLAWQKLIITWQPTYAKYSLPHRLLDVGWWLVTMAGLSCFFALRGWQGRAEWMWLIAGTVIMQTAMIMLTTSDDEFRYRLPMLPAVFLMAAAGYQRLFSGRLPREEPLEGNGSALVVDRQY